MSIILGAIAAITTVATSVVKSLAVGGLAIQGLKAIGNSLISLGKALGLIKPEIKVEELGDKAIQSEYNPENYDSYAEYVKDVEDYELDPEKSKQISEEEKIEKGIELTSGVMIERYQDLPMEKFCVAVGENPDFFTEPKMEKIAELVETDSRYIPSILEYVDGSEKDDMKIQDIVETLTRVEKAVNPDLSDKEALKNVLQARK